MSKPPIPLMAQHALSMVILEHANPVAFLALTPFFETYLQASEGLAATAALVTPATSSTVGTRQSVSILALPSEMVTTGKAGKANRSGSLDLLRQEKLRIVLGLLAAPSRATTVLVRSLTTTSKRPSWNRRSGSGW